MHRSLVSRRTLLLVELGIVAMILPVFNHGNARTQGDHEDTDSK